MTDKRVKIIKHNKIAVKFEVDSRYSPLESIGTGTYGVVCAAKDNRTGQRVAIKKIPKVFEVSVIAKRTYRELKILRHFRHENIISILDVMQPPEELSQFEDVYVVLDLMESDLHHIIHSVQPLSDEHIKFFLYQVLRGLKYIHSASVLHRDLKPSNLLVNRNCELKIGDFGMARGLASSPDEHATFMTEYVATRWYRAPELMLSFSEYTSAIDIWSVGCIFAEMLARRQLFPGKDYLNQLQLILSVVGTPDADYINGVGSERVKTYLKNLPSRTRMDLSVLFPTCNQIALELLDTMIQLDPKKRITAAEALGHKYLTRYHDPKDEPVCLPPFDFSFEKELVSQDDLHKAVVEEIMDYHKCRTPIPSQDRVKDALKKMMEDRVKEREKVEKEIIENGGVTSVKEVEVKEAPSVGKSKKAKGGKKRSKLQTQQGNMAEHKRLKLEDEEDQGLTGKDKNSLMKWKQFQHETQPFIHPVRKFMKVSEGSDVAETSVHELQQLHQQQELIIKQQAVRIEKLQRELQEVQRSMSMQISLLKDRHKTVVLKCQVAGVTLPHDLVSDSTSSGVNINHSSSSSSVIASSRQAPSSQHIVSPSKPILLQQQQRQAQLPPPLPLSSSSSLSANSSFATSSTSSLTPPTSFTSAMGLPSYSNSSPTNRIPPSSSRVPPPHVHPPPLPSSHLHRPVVSIVPLSSTCSLDSVRNAQQISSQHMLTGGGGRMPPQHHQFLSLGASQIGPPRMMLGDHPRHMQSQVDHLPTRPLTFSPEKNIRPGTGPMLLDDLSFSPLTSGELNDLDNPSGMGGIFLSPSLMPLTDDLDSILNITMPSGSGAGYGVGVKEEELSRESLVLDLNDLGPTISGPPSASLLHDWLEVSQLDPDDMDSLQRELETGTADMFNIQDFKNFTDL